MSDFCAGCRFDPKIQSGPDACPFNYLCRAFLIRNERALAGNPRLAKPYRVLAAWPAERSAAIRREADDFLDRFA